MFNLTLVTPVKKLLTDHEIEEVVVPGERGQLDFLPGHAPLVTTLSAGELRYKAKGSSEFQSVVISWGYCQVSTTGVTVLAETAEIPEELDKERVEDAIQRAETKLKEGLTVGDTIKYQRKLKRARVRLEVYKKYTN